AEDGIRDFHVTGVQTCALPISLFKTQSELIKVEKENNIRQWTNEGIRIISEMLQRRFDHVHELYDNLISTIVKYVDANQGGMFLDRKSVVQGRGERHGRKRNTN